ncbi:ribosome-inactivating family protein [Streptomyces phyllanthi]|nr:ribosome-inactivating family protein [Streptomyces phyllanthi]
MPLDTTAAAGRAGGPGHKRRSRWLRGKFLVSFLAVATILGGWAVVAPQFEQKASAIDDARDIVWDVNGGQSAYNRMINQVRQRATGGAVLRDSVLQTNPTVTENGKEVTNDDIFAVEVWHSGVASSSDAPNVRLIFRARDLFLIGWQVTPSTQGDGGEILWFQGDAPNPGYFGSDPRGNEAVNRNLKFNGSYTDLERVGRARTGLTLSGPVMEQAFRDIRASTVRARTDMTAEAAMIFIMTIAEGARFDPLQQAFGQAFAPNGQYTVTGNDAALMNSWGNVSDQMVNNMNDRTPINIDIRDNDPSTVDFVETTLGGAAALLAVALLQAKT